MGENIYTKSFLIDGKDDRTNLVIRRGGGIVEIDELDYQILEILAPNARIPTLEIAKELNTTTFIINKRIKKLIDLRVIYRYSVVIDWERIGYRWFKADLYLRDYNKIHQIIKYIELNPHLAYIDKTLGYADLELEFIVKDINQFRQIMGNISNKFPKLIRSYSYFTIEKIDYEGRF